jgi:hypothetical protein
MSNLENVIKEILKNIHYGSSNIISEQISPAPYLNTKRREFETKQMQSQFNVKKPNSLQTVPNYSGPPVTFRGIQPELDIIVPQSKINKLRVDEFQNIRTPFDRAQAEKMFGPWCKALSTGDMTGKSGKEFWFDTTSPTLAECSGSTTYDARELPDNPGTLDPNYGLTMVMAWLPTDFDLPAGLSDKEIKNAQTRITQDQDATKRVNIYKKELPKLAYTPSQKESSKKAANFKDKMGKTKDPISKKIYANYVISYWLKRNPNWAPFKGWGIYKKNWDCVAGDCTKVGKIVKLPVSPVTGKPVHTVYVNSQGKQTCSPIKYDYCLEVSWSMINANSQPNGMKKVTYLVKENEGLTYIACSSNLELKNTIAKNEDFPYPWTVKYDGYCAAIDGKSCDNVDFVEQANGTYKKVATQEPCEKSIDIIESELDIRAQNYLKLPGNRNDIFDTETFEYNKWRTEDGGGYEQDKIMTAPIAIGKR